MGSMTLADVLSPPQEERGALRWRVAVPVGTNPFLVLEWFQFSFCGASIVLITLVCGAWLTEGGLYTADVIHSFLASLLVFVAIMISFFCISLLFFGNRYFATYSFDAGGLYYEGIRGSDKRDGLLPLHIKPYPVVGEITVQKTRSRHIPWEKLTRYQDIASMRVIILRRGFWHMAKVYTPDCVTHQKAIDIISAYLGGNGHENACGTGKCA